MSDSARIDIPLRWIDGETPERMPGGATLGIPLPRGRVSSTDELAVLDDLSAPVQAQFWPLATWPDGTVKWAGVALSASDAPAAAYRVVGGPNPGCIAEVSVTEQPDGIRVDTGAVTVIVPRSGNEILRDLAIDGNVVLTAARLISSRQDSPEPNWQSRIHGLGRISSVRIEQTGPIRAVVTVRGQHGDDSGRIWLPFTLRFVFVAGASTFSATHTFIFDGDPGSDFLSSLGIRADVPLGETNMVDRHIRFTDADGGVLAEAVQGITGLRRDPGAEVREAQVSGRATPPSQLWDGEVGDLIRYVPVWPHYRLRQHSPRAYQVSKRTACDRPWIDVAHGRRAAGLGAISTPDGGLALGGIDFWQSYPSGLDIANADTATAELTLWLWSPDAEPMDLRFYHDGLGQHDYRTQLEALEITYEDYEEGLGSAHGISRTHEVSFFAWAATPDAASTAADAAHLMKRARLAPTPEALTASQVFGACDPMSRDTPAREVLEDRLEQILDFYLAQVDERDWYGFWNYGDIMHTYDADRHVWRYDVGGYAWDNSELASDLWLWASFARTGRADVFRLAEAMARHTGDVDSYHIGTYAGLGTRHNVQHWGCGCKQLRIGSPSFRRPHYFLTADEHSRDLITALRDSDRTFLALDPSRKARPDEFPPPAPSADHIQLSLGTDWGTLAATWLTDWEMTGNEWSRDRLLGTMADIAAMPHGFLHGHARYDPDVGRLAEPAPDLRLWHLTAIFGLAELCAELIELVDVPGFRDAWMQYCRVYFATPNEQQEEFGVALKGNLFPQWHSRLLAYFAAANDDADVADRAWRAFAVGGEVTPVELGPARLVVPPTVLAPVSELKISTNDAAQSSLATIQNLALIGHRLS